MYLGAKDGLFEDEGELLKEERGEEEGEGEADGFGFRSMLGLSLCFRLLFSVFLLYLDDLSGPVIIGSENCQDRF